MTTLLRAVMPGASAILVLTGACASAPLRHASDEQLASLTTADLVSYYVRLEWFESTERGRTFEALKRRDMGDVFRTIAQIFDAYDPRTRQGRSGGRSEEASWAHELLCVIDANVTRVKALAEGRAALAACRRRLDRQREAGHDREPQPYNDAASARAGVYAADLSRYERMMGRNGRDSDIAWQLERDYRVKLSEEERRRFSDFLTAEDPRYVGWSAFKVLGKVWAFENFEPYYRAYLEFKKAGEIRQ